MSNNKKTVAHPNRYQLLTFDPGGVTGWVYFCVHTRAFSRPEHSVLANVETFKHGELADVEQKQLASVSCMLDTLHNSEPFTPFNSHIQVLSENFELRQTIGGHNLLSPVRINAVIEWMCTTRGIPFKLQAPNLRLNTTLTRLNHMGFTERFRKDEFAALQHAITWLRLLKQRSQRQPWKLSDKTMHNAYWDCACTQGELCNLAHT